MSLDRKLLVLAVVPLLFAAVPTGILLVRTDRAVREMEGLDVLATLVWKMSDVEKCFDQEADNWYMFRQEHANDPAEVLAAARGRQDEARRATDAALLEFDRVLAATDQAAVPPAFRATLEEVSAERRRLPVIRELLYRRHSDAESQQIADYYLALRTRLGGALSLLIDQTSNDRIARKLQILAKTIALRKSGMDAGRKIFWAIQTYNQHGRLIPLEFADDLAHPIAVADAHWQEVLAWSAGATRARLGAYEAEARWAEPVGIIRATAANLLVGRAPPLLIESEWSRRYDFIDKELGAFVEWLREDFVATCAGIRAELTFQRNITLAVALLGSAFVLVVSQRLARRIAGPLRRTAAELAEAAQTFTAQAEQLTRASESLSQGASEQAASIEETSASLEELTAATRLNEATASRAVESTHAAAASAGEGHELVAKLTETVSEVEASGGAISRILKTIDEIAFQTNILALNAAVEAARAGEAGAGFAVVAEEVRSLARRSKDAAQETSELLAGSGTGGAGRGVVAGLARIREDAARVSTHFQSIAAKIQETDTQAGQIARSSSEQAAGLAAIATSIHRINEVTQNNAASSEEAAAAAEGLMQHAAALNESVQLLERTVGIRSRDAGPVPLSRVAGIGCITPAGEDRPAVEPARADRPAPAVT